MQTPSGFNVPINNLMKQAKDDIVGTYQYDRSQLAPVSPPQEDSFNWLNAAGLGALAAGLGGLGYLGYRNRARLIPEGFGRRPGSATGAPTTGPEPGPRRPSPAAPINVEEGRPRTVQTTDLNTQASHAAQAMNSGAQQDARRNERLGGIQQETAKGGGEILQRNTQSQGSANNTGFFNRGFLTQIGADKTREKMAERAAQGISVFDRIPGDFSALDPDDVANYGAIVRRNYPNQIENKIQESEQKIKNLRKNANQIINENESATPLVDRSDSSSYVAAPEETDITDTIKQAEANETKDPFDAVNRNWPRNAKSAVFLQNYIPSDKNSSSKVLTPDAVIQLAASGLIPTDLAKALIRTVPNAQRTSVIPKGADVLKNQMLGLGLTESQYPKYGASKLEVGEDQLALLEFITQQAKNLFTGDVATDFGKYLASGGEIPNVTTKGATAYNQGTPDPTRVFSSLGKGNISEPRASAKYQSSSYTPFMTIPSNVDDFQLLRGLVSEMDLSMYDDNVKKFGSQGEYTGLKKNIVHQLYEKNVLGMAEALGYTPEQFSEALLDPSRIENDYLQLELNRQQQGLEPIGVRRNTWRDITGQELGSVENKNSGGIAGESGQGFSDKQIESLYAFGPRELGSPDNLRTSLVLSGSGSGSELISFPDRPGSLLTKDGKTLNIDRATFGDDADVLLTPDQIANLEYESYLTLPYKINNTGPALTMSGAGESIGGIRSFGNYSNPVAADIRFNLIPSIRDKSITPFQDGKFVLNADSIPENADIETLQASVDRANELLRSYAYDPYKTQFNGLDLSDPSIRKNLSKEENQLITQQMVGDGTVKQTKQGKPFVKLPMGLVFSDPLQEGKINEAALDPKKRINTLFGPSGLKRNFRSETEAAYERLNYITQALQRFGNTINRNIFGKDAQGKNLVDRAILQGLTDPKEEKLYQQYIDNVNRNLASTFETSPAGVQIRTPNQRVELTKAVSESLGLPENSVLGGVTVQTALDPYRVIDYVPNRPALRNRSSEGTVTPISLQEAIRSELLKMEDSPVRLNEISRLKFLDGEEVLTDGEFFQVKKYAVPKTESGYPGIVLSSDIKNGTIQEVLPGESGFSESETMDVVPDNFGFLRAVNTAHKAVTGKPVGSIDFVLNRIDKLSQGDPEAIKFIGGSSSNPALERALQDAYTLAGVSNKKYQLQIQKPPAPATRETRMEGAGYDTYRGFDSATSDISTTYNKLINNIQDQIKTNPEKTGPLSQLLTQIQNDQRRFQGPFGVEGIKPRSPKSTDKIIKPGSKVVPITAALLYPETLEYNVKEAEINKFLYPKSTAVPKETQNPQNIYAEDMGRVPNASEAQALYEQSLDNSNDYEAKQDLVNSSNAIKKGYGDNQIGGYLSVDKAFTNEVVEDLLQMNKRLALVRNHLEGGPQQAIKRGKLARLIDTAKEAVLLPSEPASLSPQQQQELINSNRLLILPSGGVYGVDQGKLVRFGKQESDLVSNLGLTAGNIKNRLAQQGVRTVPLSSMGSPTINSTVNPSANLSNEAAMYQQSVLNQQKALGDLSYLYPGKSQSELKNMLQSVSPSNPGMQLGIDLNQTGYSDGQGYVPNDVDKLESVYKRDAARYNLGKDPRYQKQTKAVQKELFDQGSTLAVIPSSREAATSVSSPIEFISRNTYNPRYDYSTRKEQEANPGKMAKIVETDPQDAIRILQEAALRQAAMNANRQ